MNPVEEQLREIDKLTSELKKRLVQQLADERSESIARLAQLLHGLRNTPNESDGRVAKGLWRLCKVATGDTQADARQRLEHLASIGNVEHAYRLGLMFRDSGAEHIADALKWLEESDRGSHPRAAFDLGFIYMRFRHSAPSETRLAKARSCFERAVEQFDDAEACAHLSIMYRHGLGADVNLAKAREYLRRALSYTKPRQASPRAHASYGLECMYAGQIDKALHHLLFASRGDAARGDAMLNAARLLLRGAATDAVLEREGIADVEEAAYELLARATSMHKPSQGFDFTSPASYELARLQETGTGCTQNSEAAFTNMYRSADLGFLPAMRRIQDMLVERGLHEEVFDFKRRVIAAEGDKAGDFKQWDSDDYTVRSEAHVSFFNEIAELLDEGDYAPALNRIMALYEWAGKSKSNPHAKRTTKDAGIRYHCGVARRGLGQIREAIHEFELSAAGRDDFRHQSMCYSAMAECAEISGDFDKAAQYYFDGFLVSSHADMWIKHARAIFTHNPARQRVALLKIDAFMKRDNTWIEGKRKIEFPVDKEPIKTCVAYAELLWRLPASMDLPDGDAVQRTQGQLLFYLRKHAKEEGRVEKRILYALARGARWDSVRREVTWLVENVGLGRHADLDAQQDFPPPLLAQTEGVAVLNTIRDGLGRAHAQSADVAAAVVKRIIRTPDLIRYSPELAHSLTRLLWRCVVQAYYQDSRNPADFRKCVQAILLPLVECFVAKDEPELLRDWMFELVAADKATVEYGLVAEFLESMREKYLDPYTGSYRDVYDRLVAQGTNDLRELARRLQEPEAMLSHEAFGDLANDTAQYASLTLTQNIKRLLHVSVLPRGVRFHVDLGEPGDTEALLSTAARIDLTLLLARIIGDEGPLHELMCASKHISVRGRWTGRGTLSVSFLCVESSKHRKLHDAAERVLGNIAANHRRIIASAACRRNRDNDMIFTLDATLTPGSALHARLGEPWREYLISLIQEHTEHRLLGISYPSFFAALRSQMPPVGVAAGATAVEQAARWTLILHAVSDRFHAFFAGSLLRTSQADRSPVGALHDLKKALSLLRQNALRHSLTEADLVNFRQRVRALTPTAERLLKKTLTGWRLSWFDLRAEFERPAGLLAEVFGHAHEGVNLLGKKEVRIKAPKEQVLLAMRELLSNAQTQANGTTGTPRSPVIVEFQEADVVIRNPKAHAVGKDIFSTGKGMAAAEGWLKGCGMTLKQENDGPGFAVRVTLAREEGAAGHA